MVDIQNQCLGAFVNEEKEVAAKLLPTELHPRSLTTTDNRTLLHLAAENGWDDICRLLVEQYHLSATSKDGYGWSPLHLACQHGREAVVSYLLSLPTVQSTINDEGVFRMSALDSACSNEHTSVMKLLLRQPSILMPTNKLLSDKFPVLSLLANRIEWNTEFPIKPYFRVFMAGNSGAGKTTLTTAMLRLDPSSTVSHDDQVSVKTLTAGICPIQCSG